MEEDSEIVIIGAGVFGLSSALELKKRGFRRVTVVDRHKPPVPDGSSTDISRIIRFDYGDPIYTAMAKNAYDRWSTSPVFKDIFFSSPFILATTQKAGRAYINSCTSCLDQHGLPWKPLKSLEEVTELSHISTPTSRFHGYRNEQAGWADAKKAIIVLRDQCMEAGVTFQCGASGTVTGLIADSTTGKIHAAETQSGDTIQADFFIIATGAWTSGLVPMHNTVLATAQVLGFMKLSPAEMEKYKKLPIFINFDSGWFCFPPHSDTQYLKVAVHGWGYTRYSIEACDPKLASRQSLPPLNAREQRTNFAPADGIQRLSDGFLDIVPELAARPFERTAICWYTDTPTGDFIMDYHPDFNNVFLATGGSGHAFKFLPVLGEYTVDAMQRKLPNDLQNKWRFRQEYRHNHEIFKGDGSRAGPARREFTDLERSKL